MPKLVLRPEEPGEKVFELAPGATSVGRTQDNGVWLLDASLSRRHAEIELQGTRVVVRDLGSKNGTFVDGRRIEQEELRPGASVRFGNVTLLFEPRPGAAPAKRAAAAGPASICDLAGTSTRASMQDLVGARTRIFRAEAHGRAQEQLRMMLRVSELLASPGDDLLAKVLELAMGILEAERGAVLMVDERTGELAPAAVRTAARGSRPSDSGDAVVWSQHVVDYVRQNAVGALFADAQADARLADAASILDQSIRASMCAPLRPREEVIGVLYVDHRSVAHRFGPEDLELLTAFANQAAVAIDNARLWLRLEEEAVRRETMTRFFPPATVERILAAPGGAIGTVDTEVTALFSDIGGFTAMSAAMEPREIVELLNDYFPAMADVVFAHEGTLEKYIGDALLAVWGAPFARDDDADRALEAAVAMQQGLVRLNDAWASKGARQLAIHVGLNTGRVCAGNIGSSRYLQYATIGDATNVASRVCDIAGDGEILIAESTRARLRRCRFGLDPLAPVVVKGKEEPLSLHRVRWKG